MPVAKVTIGLPVYNGERLLARAIAALCRQSCGDFELVISDNASTDGTQEICECFAREDARIRYIRQQRNLGAFANFLFVLEQAHAPNFMWAAHDDVWAEDFVAANQQVLADCDDVVLSVSKAEFRNEQGQVVDIYDMGTSPLLKSRRENLEQYLNDPAVNSRFYGLLRTEVVRKCTRDIRLHWATDWLIMARSLRYGKHFEVERCLFHRGPEGISSAPVAAIRRMYAQNLLFRTAPLLPFTWNILCDTTMAKSPQVLWALWKWNKHYLNKMTRSWRRNWWQRCWPAWHPPLAGDQDPLEQPAPRKAA